MGPGIDKVLDLVVLAQHVGDLVEGDGQGDLPGAAPPAEGLEAGIDDAQHVKLGDEVGHPPLGQVVHTVLPAQLTVGVVHLARRGVKVALPLVDEDAKEDQAKAEEPKRERARLGGIQEVGEIARGKIAFLTTADIQSTLPKGDPEEIRAEVRELIE